MKKILLACLLGMGMLTPAIEAKSSMVTIISRIINITIEGWVFLASSGPASGNIQQIQIYDAYTGTLVRSQECAETSCSMNLSGLRSGMYLGVVIATNEVTKKKFTIGG